MPRKVTTSAVDASQRLDDWLAARLGLAVADTGARIAAGAVYVDGKRERDAGRVLRGGEKIAVHEPSTQAPSFRIVFEDADLLVVDKPAGLPVVAGRAGGTSLAELLPGALPFHRIDEATSGLVLFTKGGGSPGMARWLAEGSLVREYLAIVLGTPPPVLDAAIGPDPSDRRRMKAGVPGGKPARTDVTIERSRVRTLIRARLTTGLTHQIRVHLAGAGHPVVGDTIYGGAPAARLALHATLLAWPGGRAESPLPAELDAMLA